MKQLNTKTLQFFYDDHRGWIRLFGKGIAWKHICYGLSFGQRNGNSKYLKIFNYYFYYLK